MDAPEYLHKISVQIGASIFFGEFIGRNTSILQQSYVEAVAQGIIVDSGATT